ncbi:ThiF family adenylyltransferase [Pseudactinotalea terrae]|uniref:ThiF family adenylyltransferase n=1 Tax=Pseudactinotalea terrae TaxID=1743262 RepID=UPI0012E25753|nr:ThiF family adenylyltransferase [Pseudactinotalea terrae]
MEPLVEPGPPLTPDQAETYSRHLLLPALGEIAQRRLLAARVCVMGAGGLGSPALLYLAAAGVGTIGIVDDDVVDTTNLQRQVLHGVADVGRPKLDSATRRLRDIAPDVVIEPCAERLTADNATEILGGYDLVLDGTDTFETRYAVSDACAELGIPLVWGSVLGFDAQISVFWSRQGTVPGGVTLRDLFPDPPPAGSVPSCAEAGVLGSLTGQVGSVMATEAIKLITGVGEPLLGRLLVLDGLQQRWTEVPLRPRDAAAAPRQPAPATAPLAQPAPDDAVDVAQVRDALERGLAITFLDVREPFELAGGTIPGSVHVPLAHVMTEVGRRSIPREGIVVAYCRVGPRAELAAGQLRGAGIDARWLVGGYPAWAAAAESAST